MRSEPVVYVVDDDADSIDHLGEPARQNAAIRIAQVDDRGSRFCGGLNAPERVLLVGIEPVEEMLGVVMHFTAGSQKMGLVEPFSQPQMPLMSQLPWFGDSIRSR